MRRDSIGETDLPASRTSVQLSSGAMRQAVQQIHERRSRSHLRRLWSRQQSGCETLLRNKVAIRGSVAQVGSGNLVGVTDAREELSAATRRYRRTEAAHDAAREAVVMAVVAALRAGLSPTDVERLSPFSGAYVRKLAREHQIPPAPPGPKRSVR